MHIFQYNSYRITTRVVRKKQLKINYKILVKIIIIIINNNNNNHHHHHHHNPILARRPELALNNKKKNLVIVDFAVPADHIVKIK